MLTRRKLVASLAFVLFTVPASAGPIVYAVNLSQQFGTVDLATGVFHQIGPDRLEGSSGLVPGPNGSLFTLGFSGYLDSINPATGVTSVVGPTGLADCGSPTSPCGPTATNALGKLGGNIYATDLSNNLYSVNPATGTAKRIGPTGIPAVTFNPNIPNPDGSLNIFDESLFDVGGKLYAYFDSGTLDLETSTTTPVVPAELYQIDPSTGHATPVARTVPNLSTIVNVDGTVYAFHANAIPNQVVTLNLANGNIGNPVSELYPDAGQLILGASPVPEPASVVLAGIGIAAILSSRRRRKFSALALSIVSMALYPTSNVLAQGLTFVTIDFPGAASTTPWGINTRGDIVGLYVSADKVTHSFLLTGGQYSTIDFPEATGTELYAINPQGDVGGVYTLAGARHGFLLSGGQFTKIDFPDAATTEVNTINPRGDIVGDYVLAGTRHGYLLSGGQFSTIDFPGATFNLPSGINPQGDIAGAYGTGHGFLLSDGDFTTFDFPGSTFTNATGINARGDIVGQYRVSGVNHGYLLSGGQFTTIDFPGAAYTGATAIHPRGDILGRYQNADGVFHGFLVTGFRPACVIPMPAPKIAAVTHSGDFTLVTAARPAAAGEVLALFASGLGPTRPGVGGQAPVDPLVEVRVNGRSAMVFGAVGFPGAVDGYQVNFRLPDNTVKGSASIELSAGGVAGAPVKIMVQ